MSLAGKTLFITGASRGIGLAIALRAARDGANIVIAAKSAQPHPKLPGTIFTAAEEIERAGGKALPLAVDIRDEASVLDAVDKARARFGGIDICVNNASAISLTGALDTDMKKFDLMHQVNGRGTFLVSKTCLPHLLKAANPHILMLAPPPEMTGERLGKHLAYSMAKYGMSMCVIGLAAEFGAQGVAVNALQPRAWVATAAIEFRRGSEEMEHCRKPAIMADAAYAILTRPSRSFTGNFCTDDTVLYESGVRDFDAYRVDPSKSLNVSVISSDNPPPPGVTFEACTA